MLITGKDQAKVGQRIRISNTHTGFYVVGVIDHLSIKLVTVTVEESSDTNLAGRKYDFLWNWPYREVRTVSRQLDLFGD